MYKFILTIACTAWFAGALFAQPGTLDSNFGNSGVVTFLPQPTLNKAYGIAQQQDLKILIAGYALDGVNTEFTLTRLLSNGTLDTNFGVDGVVHTYVGNGDACYAMALQSDGKILLAGSAAVATNGSMDFAVLRYLPNGVLDSTFSNDGIQTFSFGTGDDVAQTLAIQPDGYILVAGTSTNGNGSLMAIARLKTDGSLDPAFTGDGKNTLAIGTIFTKGYGLAILPDGKILLTGAAKFGMQDDVALARFLPTGFADGTFGTGGHITTNLGSDADSGNAIALQSDGKILVAGITGDTRDFALLRYLQDGTLDTNFGNQGVVTTDFAGSDDYANSVLVQPDGKILVGGYAYNTALPDFAVARYLPNGMPDSDFGLDGRVTTDFDNGYDYGFPMTFQSDGKLLLGGYSYSSGHTAFAIARYITGLNVGVVDFSAAISGFVAPNPIQESAIFQFSLVSSGTYSLTLEDAQGRQVRTYFSHKNLASGNHQENLDFSNTMAAGWYLLHLSDGKQSLTVKILKK